MNGHDHTLDVGTDIVNGLSVEEAEKRLVKYGYNEVPEKKPNPLLKFATKFSGLTAWMLEFTVIMELILGKYLEACVIVVLLFFNAVVSFIQEEKANGAVNLLRQKLAVKARVKRSGAWVLIPAKELVPGDVVRLRAGDLLPADVHVVEGHVDVDQSALTGESLTVERNIGDLLYSGSTVSRGEITGAVAATGLKTYFGRTVELVQIARPKTHIEEKIAKVVRWLLVMVIASVAVGMGLALLRGIDLAEIAPLTVVLLVSAIPVALPTMFTISMALGSLELSRKGVIVTRLDAVEDAASMDVLCVDKTGTITLNKLSLSCVAPCQGFTENEVILYGAMASQEANQDPIDLAFLDLAKHKNLVDTFVQKSFVPFDPKNRKTEALVKRGDEEFKVMKGAVTTIAKACGLKGDEIRRLEVESEEWATKGYRTLAVAKTNAHDKPRLVGLAMLHDTARPDSKQLIHELRELGISVKMLTGDATPIAKEIASEVGLSENVISASALKALIKENPIDAAVAAEKTDGFAEVYPEDKYTIVKSLQANGKIVGMTGDGVNDAPALKQAEVGIAVSNATDIAKKSSSVVLSLEGFEGIFDMVVIGRMVYQRISTWTISKIIRTCKRVVFIVLAFILTSSFVVSTLNMILLLFLSDYVTLSLSTDKVRYSEKPERDKTTSLVKLGVVYGSLIVAESLLILYIGMEYFGLASSIEKLQTFIFVWLTLSGYFTVLSIRERKHFWESKPSLWLTLALVLNTVIVYILSTLGLLGLSSITSLEFLFILAYGFVVCLLINDSVKVPLTKIFGVAL